MALPTIIAPPEAPVFLADGHEIEELSRYAQVQMQVGHGRARRVRSLSERMVDVSWFLEAEAMQAVYEWYEGTLQAGTQLFAARLATEGLDLVSETWPSLSWWTARWVQFQTEMMNLGRGRVYGRLYLIEGPFVAGPDLGSLAMEIRAPLRASATPTIPPDLAMEISAPLDGFTDETS